MQGATILLVIVAKSAFASPAISSSLFGPQRSERLGRRDDKPDTYGPPTDTTTASSAPYPPRGWTPKGDLLLLPGETHSSQLNNYGTPPPPPNSIYGVASTNRPSTTSTTEINQEPEGSELDSQVGNLNEESGQYFVLHNGKLQRVKYSGRQRRGKQYEAQVQYEELEPVQTPIYSYQNVPFHLSL